VENSTTGPQEATIYNIVGERGYFVPPPGWLPYYRPVRHRRSMWRGAIPGFVLIGLGAALFLAAWAHYRQK
jgi:hypothetical protein